MDVHLHPALAVLFAVAILAKAWCAWTLLPQPRLPRFLFWFVAAQLVWNVALFGLSWVGAGYAYLWAYWAGAFTVDVLSGCVVVNCLLEGV